jgi:hypothetical protein
MGPFAGNYYNSLYLVVNSVSTIHPHYKGKGVDMGKKSLPLVEHICMSANFENNKEERRGR